MGSIYRPKYRAADGSLREAAVWWLKYRVHGRVVRESSGTTSYEEAKRLLKLREGRAAEGRPVAPHADRVTVAELAEDLRNDYRANGRRSLERLEHSLGHLLPFFGSRRASQVTSADVRAYVAQRQREGAANATINRELAALKRMFTLGLDAEKIHRRPKIVPLKEQNVRRGFFEREQFEAVRAQLPDYARPIVTFAYITGWRVRSEILPLQWHQVDFAAGTVRLEPGTTKNDEGRVFVMTPELRACLEAQREATTALEQRLGVVIPWVFHRNGRPLKSIQRAWRTACRRAGLPGRLLHDFRRTAVRNLERAGVPRAVAMKMVGHKTEAIYRRYAIVDEAMLREAAEKLAVAQAARAKFWATWPPDGEDGVLEVVGTVVGREGIEPPTPGFSVLCSTD